MKRALTLTKNAQEVNIKENIEYFSSNIYLPSNIKRMWIDHTTETVFFLTDSGLYKTKA
jgi:hypothetical protein